MAGFAPWICYCSRVRPTWVWHTLEYATTKEECTLESKSCLESVVAPTPAVSKKCPHVCVLKRSTHGCTTCFLATLLALKDFGGRHTSVFAIRNRWCRRMIIPPLWSLELVRCQIAPGEVT